ncbi:hypothetical protein BJ138DRAFT_1105467 [Hygrophoropsis aurantiaca]|uniref:Uncharacterized protein n=1 Tax=Hygrophoropsis aurantiaca TaxID=72124 RepID=A0ACB7ZYW9_9AGAM|nr:hypothetical protein BJ138DRAFT_1105467 [Hygrophoropsis aurantiaca]
MTFEYLASYVSKRWLDIIFNIPLLWFAIRISPTSHPETVPQDFTRLQRVRIEGEYEQDVRPPLQFLSADEHAFRTFNAHAGERYGRLPSLEDFSLRKPSALQTLVLRDTTLHPLYFCMLFAMMPNVSRIMFISSLSGKKASINSFLRSITAGLTMDFLRHDPLLPSLKTVELRLAKVHSQKNSVANLVTSRKDYNRRSSFTLIFANSRPGRVGNTRELRYRRGKNDGLRDVAEVGRM